MKSEIIMCGISISACEEESRRSENEKNGEERENPRNISES